MASLRRGWIVFGAGALAALGALSWVTSEVLRLEREGAEAEAEAALEESVRLALWRMDSYMAPILAEESSRPEFHYSPFYAARDAYSRLWYEILPGEVLVPSPLLVSRGGHAKLYFEIAPDGGLSSPQAPRGNMRDNAEARYVAGERIEEAERLLAEIASFTSAEDLRSRLADGAMTEVLAAAPPPAASSSQSLLEWGARSRISSNISIQSRLAEPPARSPVAQGTFVPAWAGPEGDELLLVRSVRRGEQQYLQGVWLDWDGLRHELLALVGDLLPSAALRPSGGEAAEAIASRTLASLPAVLEPNEVASPRPDGGGLTPARIALGAAWVAVLGAVLAGGLSLRASLDLSERRGRFVSAVTHELRTPLTTFRLYTDMLESGLVADDSARAEYLATLRREAERLSLLVENVLAYARLEEGPAARAPQPLDAGDLLDRAARRARERAESCGMRLVSTVDPGAGAARVLADEAAVEQIVFNLVDNACKYAAPPEARNEGLRTVRLEAAREADSFVIRVRDRGPGIAPSERRHVFEPFRRGPVPSAGARPSDNGTGAAPGGAGLGLALSLGLARAMEGDLRCEDPGKEGGAVFALRLRLAGA